jgi:hypothetical protein
MATSPKREIVQKPAPIVAELGRPETSEETAARKAETSRKHRANNTLFNLVIAIVASLALVVFLALVVVRPDPAPAETVNVADIASKAASTTSGPLLAPVVPLDWYANKATIGTRAEVLTWYVGYVTSTTQFIALNQGIDANPTWQAFVLDAALETGTVTVGGLTWTVYDQREADSPGNHAYSMATQSNTSTIVLHGTASTAEFELLAASIASELE